MRRRPLQLFAIRGLNLACTSVDAVAYRPFIVKLTEWLPRWWSCQLARLSMTLDDRWGTGFWTGSDAPPAPGGLCSACRRRAAWHVVGGTDQEDESVPDDDYLAQHPVELCGWCQLDFSAPPSDYQELDRILSEARKRSVSWRWRV